MWSKLLLTISVSILIFVCSYVIYYGIIKKHIDNLLIKKNKKKEIRRKEKRNNYETNKEAIQYLFILNNDYEIQLDSLVYKYKYKKEDLKTILIELVALDLDKYWPSFTKALVLYDEKVFNKKSSTLSDEKIIKLKEYSDLIRIVNPVMEQQLFLIEEDLKEKLDIENKVEEIKNQELNDSFDLDMDYYKKVNENRNKKRNKL